LRHCKLDIPALCETISLDNESLRTAHDIVQRISVLLAKVEQESSKLSDVGQKALQEAAAITNGLDPYLEKMSTPHPDILVR
jgi:hypothetical protein